MRDYTHELYTKITEEEPHPILKANMKAEAEIIKNVQDAERKTFLDLGAGHGRMVAPLASQAKKCLFFEINEDMLPELRRRARQFDNTNVLKRDITNLREALDDKELSNPVLLLLQNTLGTIEGNWKDVLREMKTVADEYEGDVILSLFRQEALETWGIDLYSGISDLTGEPDIEGTNFSRGLFRSTTGYTSKWRSKEEIAAIKQFFNGTIENEISSDEWTVFHISMRNE